MCGRPRLKNPLPPCLQNVRTGKINLSLTADSFMVLRFHVPFLSKPLTLFIYNTSVLACTEARTEKRKQGYDLARKGHDNGVFVLLPRLGLFLICS